jgi:hypothetical protein
MLGKRRARQLALALLVLATAGCGTDPSLRSLEKDPTATLVVSGTHLDHESKERSHTALGMPVHAQITRRFALGNVAPEDAVAEAREFAIAHGWTPERSRPASFSATKRIDAIRADLLVTVPTYNGPGASLYVYLTAF